jgi:hypothetical protein
MAEKRSSRQAGLSSRRHSKALLVTIGTTFYRRAGGFVGPFAFVNFAKWKDGDSSRAATSSAEFLEIVKTMKDFRGFPGLF